MMRAIGPNNVVDDPREIGLWHIVLAQCGLQSKLNYQSVSGSVP